MGRLAIGKPMSFIQKSGATPSPGTPGEGRGGGPPSQSSVLSPQLLIIFATRFFRLCPSILTILNHLVRRVIPAGKTVFHA